MMIQHHGTTLVKYFYYTLKNSSDNPESVKEEGFTYPGPKPQSREAAIIMMADSVEAAVRSIQEPTVEKIENMVNNIIKDKLDSGQLSECELTFRDLETIKSCFLKVLKGIYHSRIICRSCDAEIGYLNLAAFCKNDVLRFNIAVNDVLLVSVLKCTANLHGKISCLTS